MNALMKSYASDDEDSGDDRPSDYQSSWSKGLQSRKSLYTPRQADVNYEEVQMDLSEDSDDSRKGRNSPPPKDWPLAYRKEPPRSERSSTDARYRDDFKSRKDENPDRGRNDDRNRPDDRSRPDDRPEGRFRPEDRPRREDDRSTSKYDRDEDRDRRDRYRDDKDKYRDDDRDRYRDRRDRDRDSRDKRSRRSSSRDRKRGSRSPKYDRGSRRSRSRSRERYPRGGYSRKPDRGGNRPPYERQDSRSDDPKPADDANKDRFFMPGITGRFKEQIEKRKMLWQKKDPQPDNTAANVRAAAAAAAAAPAASNTSGGSRITKVWEATTFAQDNDGKVASKFKRLMGIRNSNATDADKPATDVLKKQEEMFSSMEQQYEVARTATHTMRGVGLGFSSFQR